MFRDLSCGSVLAALVLLLTTLTFGFACSISKNHVPPDPLARAIELHRYVPLIDGHNDLPWQIRELAGRDISRMDVGREQPRLQTDIPRLRAGGVGGVFWSVYVPVSLRGPEALRATMEEIDTVYRLARRYPETFQLAFSSADVERAFAGGRIASLIGMEGGHSIDNSLAARVGGRIEISQPDRRAHPPGVQRPGHIQIAGPKPPPRSGPCRSGCERTPKRAGAVGSAHRRPGSGGQRPGKMTHLPLA